MRVSDSPVWGLWLVQLTVVFEVYIYCIAMVKIRYTKDERVDTSNEIWEIVKKLQIVICPVLHSIRWRHGLSTEDTNIDQIHFKFFQHLFGPFALSLFSNLN